MCSDCLFPILFLSPDLRLHIVSFLNFRKTFPVFLNYQNESKSTEIYLTFYYTGLRVLTEASVTFDYFEFLKIFRLYF